MTWPVEKSVLWGFTKAFEVRKAWDFRGVGLKRQ